MEKKYHQISKLIIYFMVLILVLCGCSSGEKAPSKNEKFQTFLDESFKTLACTNGMVLHFTLAHPEKYEIKKEDYATLPDLSEKGNAQYKKTLQSIEKELNTFNMNSLSTEEQRIALLLKNELTLSMDSLDQYAYYTSTLGDSGSMLTISNSFVNYYFMDETDIQVYEKLLTKLPAYLEQALAYEVSRQEKVGPSSKSLIKQTTASLDEFLKKDLADNPYISSFQTKIKEADFLSDEEKASYLTKNETLIKQTVLPAYEKLMNGLSKSLKGSKKTLAVCGLPNGSDYYSFRLRYQVGTDKSPEECIKALTTTMDTNYESMKTILEENPDFKVDYYSALPEETDASKILDTLKNNSLIEFPAISTVNCKVEEDPYHSLGLSAQAYYVLPPMDYDGDNHIYWSNVSSVDTDFFTTLAHEGYPGHLYQTNYFYQNMYHPIQAFLRTDGYTEGWGEYAENYSYDFMKFSNLDDDQTLVMQKYMKAENVFSLYLSSLCDLYVNYKGYDQKKLTSLLSQYDISEEEVSNMYSYVLEHPFVYLNYGIGYLEFSSFLEDAKSQEGFRMVDFHENMLKYGSCPFYMISSFLEEDK